MVILCNGTFPGHGVNKDMPVGDHPISTTGVNKMESGAAAAKAKNIKKEASETLKKFMDAQSSGDKEEALVALQAQLK